MSDCITKIIPLNPDVQFSQDQAEQAVEYLRTQVCADAVQLLQHAQTEFIDCGDGLAEIRCPHCGAVLAFDWWSAQMDAAALSEFTELHAELPCCGRECSLNDLHYHAPCGFARSEIQILNPQKPIDKLYIAWLRTQLGMQFRVIEAHV